jgi:group I intron endonuclease
MKLCGIYKIENKINGKVYIGQSVNIKHRIAEHKCNATNLKYKDVYDLFVYRAIRKYGLVNFSFSVIEQCPKELLNEREQYWISYYKSNEKDHGYNVSDGGISKYIKSMTSKSNISEKKRRVKEIKDLLINSDMSIQDIANRFGMTDASITNINRGHSFFCIDETYPLRDTRKKTFYYCPNCGTKLSCKYSKLCKKCDAERQQKTRSRFVDVATLKEDLDNYGVTELSKKYGVSVGTVCKWVKKYNLQFKGWNQTRRLKYEQVQHTRNQQNY